MRVGLDILLWNPNKQLIKYSLIENESRCVILYNQALPNFQTYERSWRRGHGGKIYAHGDVFFFFFFFFFFFLLFDPVFFPPFSLPPFSFALSCAFGMLGHLSRAWLMLTGLHYDGTTVNRTFLVRKFDHFFFLTSEAFRALSWHAREVVFILLFSHILPY